jgi:hypothetical protein
VKQIIKYKSTTSFLSLQVTGIQALISKLRGSNDDSADLAEDEVWLNPLDADIYCNNGTETALHNAVKRREQERDLPISIVITH